MSKELSRFSNVYKHLISKLQRKLFLHSSRKEQFEKIFRSGGFGGDAKSLSGVGSDLVQTSAIRKEIPSLLECYNIQSILDIPCGDWYWMQEVNLDGINYFGADIVADIIKINTTKFSSSNKNFLVMDMVKGRLPKVDLILCRDCFIHMKLIDIQAAIINFKSSGSKWLLTTTFDNTMVNEELDSNFFRPINLRKPPFSFPDPIASINEQCTLDGGAYSDKGLVLWRIDDLP